MGPGASVLGATFLGLGSASGLGAFLTLTSGCSSLAYVWIKKIVICELSRSQNKKPIVIKIIALAKNVLDESNFKLEL